MILFIDVGRSILILDRTMPLAEDLGHLQLIFPFLPIYTKLENTVANTIHLIMPSPNHNSSVMFFWGLLSEFHLQVFLPTRAMQLTPVCFKLCQVYATFRNYNLSCSQSVIWSTFSNLCGVTHSSKRHGTCHSFYQQ